MEKYSESVKDAQEKLEQAEKKATDVSVGLGRFSGPGTLARSPRHEREGRRGPRSPAPEQTWFPLCNTSQGQVYTSNSG